MDSSLGITAVQQTHLSIRARLERTSVAEHSSPPAKWVMGTPKWSSVTSRSSSQSIVEIRDHFVASEPTDNLFHERRLHCASAVEPSPDSSTQLSLPPDPRMNCSQPTKDPRTGASTPAAHTSNRSQVARWMGRSRRVHLVHNAQPTLLARSSPSETETATTTGSARNGVSAR